MTRPIVDLVMERLQSRIGSGDSMTLELASWLGVYGEDRNGPGAADGLWSPRDVAIAGVRSAIGRETGRSFAAGLASLRSRRYFEPHSPEVFEADPLAIFGVAIGVWHIGDTQASAWVAEIARRASCHESDAWRIGLLAAAAALAGSTSTQPMPPELVVVVASKMAKPVETSVCDAAIRVALRLDEPPPDQAAVRLAALHFTTAHGAILALRSVPSRMQHGTEVWSAIDPNSHRPSDVLGLDIGKDREQLTAPTGDFETEAATKRRAVERDAVTLRIIELVAERQLSAGEPLEGGVIIAHLEDEGWDRAEARLRSCVPDLLTWYPFAFPPDRYGLTVDGLLASPERHRVELLINTVLAILHEQRKTPGGATLSWVDIQRKQTQFEPTRDAIFARTVLQICGLAGNGSLEIGATNISGLKEIVNCPDVFAFAELRREETYRRREQGGRPWDPLLAPSALYPSQLPQSSKALNMNKIKILFIAANPSETSRLALDMELRDIKEKIRATEHRDAFVMEVVPAARPDDFEQALLEHKPMIVHFSGHGSGVGGIVLESDGSAGIKLMDADSLGDLFRLIKKNVRVVVLNACYSEDQAKEIVREIDFVVGMRDTIGDLAARKFAASFYRAIGFGESIETAFGLGVNALKRERLTTDVNVPVLLVRDRVSTEVRLLEPR